MRFLSFRKWEPIYDLNNLNLCYYHLSKNLFRLTWENAGSYLQVFTALQKFRLIDSILARVTSVFVWFRSKERLRNGIFGFGSARNGTRGFPPHPIPSPLFYLRHFSRGLCLSFLVLCSKTARKRLLPRLTRFKHSLLCSFSIKNKTKRGSSLW